MTNRRAIFWTGLALFTLIFVFLIRSILLPFVLGMFTAYFLDPAADKLEKKGFSRTMATLVLTGCFFLSIILLSIIVVPVIANQLSGLIASLPGYIEAFSTRYREEISHWLGDLSVVQVEQFQSSVADFSGVMVKLAGEFITSLFHSGMAIVNLLSLILITPVVAFYLLRDWDHIMTRMDRLLPRQHADTIRTQIFIIDATLAGFVRGTLTVCAMLGVYYAVGLSLVGLKFGIVIGLATGMLVIVPYVGLMLGMTIGLGVAFFQFEGWGEILAVLAVFVSGQIIEGNFVTPKLIGEKVGLHPVWIIFGMLAGAALFGFVGVLLAVPATAVIGVLIRFAIQRYLQSGYYKGDSTLPPAAPPVM